MSIPFVYLGESIIKISRRGEYDAMKKTRLWIGISSLLVGVMLIAIPLYYDWQTTNQNRELMAAMEMVNTDQSEENSQDTSYSKEDLEGVFQLEIPAIGLEQYVLPQTTEENLAISLTQIVEDRNPETDNITIAGHRGYRGDRHFRNLPDVKKGDTMMLTNNDDGERFLYQVTTVSKVEEDAVDVLESTGPEITLITCTIDGKQRVVVKGELVEE